MRHIGPFIVSLGLAIMFGAALGAALGAVLWLLSMLGLGWNPGFAYWWVVSGAGISLILLVVWIVGILRYDRT